MYTEKLTSVKHPFEPVADKDSRILILGSFPSVKSRENMFYYGHPQNRFWRMLADIVKADVPQTIDDKKNLILGNGFALWDTLAMCEIHASADSSIRHEVPNDIPGLVKQYGIEAVMFNGNAAYRYFEKYYGKDDRLEGIIKKALPSTSPANAACSYERLVGEWGSAVNELKEKILKEKRY